MKTNIKTLQSHKQKGGEKIMKHYRNVLGIGVAIFSLVTLITSTSWAAEDIRNSKHNLSASRNTTGTYPDGTPIGDKVQFNDTTEVCVFCHTPHGGASVAGGAAPLWNRTPLTKSTSYNMYSSPNFDNVGNPSAPQGVSLACLSCHDGTVAFDSLINTPGSGTNINAAGRAGWNGSGDYVDSTTGTFSDAAKPFPNIGEPASGVINLSNDHPISMEVPCLDPQFSEICATLTNNGAKVTYITRENGVYPTDIRDRLRTYPTTAAGKYFIECASCHNPHEATSSRFLRHPSINANNPKPTTISDTELNQNRNAGSLLCLSCHQK